MFASLLLAAASPAPAPISPQDFWAPAGTPRLVDGHGLSHDLVFGPDNKAYASYQDGTSVEGGASVRRLVGSTWEPIGGPGAASRGRAWYNRMAFDASGQLYLVCRDYFIAGMAGVRRYDSTSGAWEDVGDNASLDEAHFTDIAISPTGEPWIVFADRTTNPEDMARVRRFTNGAWQYVGSAPLSVGEAKYCTIAFSPSGEAHVGFSDVGLGEMASVVRWDGTNWVPVGALGFTGVQTTAPSIGFDPAGTPHIAWMRHHYEVNVDAFLGGQWVNQGGNAALPGQLPDLDSEIWRMWLPFDFDSQGRPTVGYQSRDDGGRLVVRRLEASGWQTLGGLFVGEGRTDYPALTIGPDDTPWVIYRDGGIGSSTSVRRLASEPTTYCPPTTTQSGCTPITQVSGQASLSSGSLSLSVTRVSPDGVGVLLVGFEPTRLSLPSGQLCVGDPAMRIDPQGTGSSSNACGGTLGHTFTPVEFSTLLGGTPGTLYTQWWFRGPTATSQTTSWLASAIAIGVGP